MERERENVGRLDCIVGIAAIKPKSLTQVEIEIKTQNK